jgi:hypothetical protein
MKRFILFFALLLSIITPSFANDESLNFKIPRNFKDLEAKGITRDIQSLDKPYETHSEELELSDLGSPTWELDLKTVTHPSFAWNSQDFLESVQSHSIQDFDQVRFIGIHRHWIKQLKRLFKDQLIDDREAFIEAANHPAVGRREYDDLYQEQRFQNHIEPWTLGRYWFPDQHRRVRVIGSFAPFRTYGPLTLTKDLHLRVDLREVDSVNKALKVFGQSRSRSRTTASKSAARASKPRPKNPIGRVRVGFNASLGGTTGIRTVTMKMGAVLYPAKYGKLAFPCSVSARYDIGQNELKVKFRIVLATF